MRWMSFSAAAFLLASPLWAAGDRPTAPTQLAGSVSGDTVQLTWSAATDDEGIEGYNVYRDNQYIDTVAGTHYEGSFDSSSLHQFHIVAFDSKPRNYSAASEAVFLPENLVPTDTSIPPTQPTGLIGDISGSTVNLSWVASTDDESVQGYNVYQNNSYIDTVHGTTFTAEVNPNESHSYYVVAFDGRLNFSVRSDSLILPDDGDVDTSQPPSVPAGLSGSTSESGGVVELLLTWDASADNTGVSGYNVYVNDTYIDTVFSTAYTDILEPGEVNTYSVVAFDIDGNFSRKSGGLLLPETTEPIDEESPPSTPYNLSGAVVFGAESDTVTLSWRASTDNLRVIGYNVYRNDGYVSTVFDTSYTEEVSPESVNTYFIVAFDQHNNFSSVSAAEKLRLPGSINQAPYFLNLEDQTVTVGPLWEFVVQPKDSDGDVPGLFISTLPEGMLSIDNLDGTRTLRWQPLQPAVGAYPITFTAFDASDSSIRTVRTITLNVVLPDDLSIIPNRAPTIDALDTYVVRHGDTIVMRVKAVDANGTVPNLFMSNLPDGATFDVHPLEPRIRVLRWPTDETDLGIQEFSFWAEDSEDSNLKAYSSTRVDIKNPADFLREGDRLKNLAAQVGIKFGYAALLEVTEQPDGDLYSSIAAEEFDLVTPENSMKWGYVNPEPGEYRFKDADLLIEFAEENNMDVHGHALVWYAQLPQWMQASEVDDREGYMNNFIDTMLGRYPDVAVWDVVNEVFEDDGSFRNSIWYEAMGAEHINKAFIRARSQDADAQLIYNDYDVSFAGPKSDAMYDMVSNLVAEGVPIDGVGFQMHLTSDFDQFDEVAANFQRIADLGLDIYVTELDVALQPGDSADDQAVVFAEAVKACVEQSACVATQIWGFTDRYTWRKPNPALVLDADYQAKPAYTALQSALK